jgi:NAD(P)-dependent dehydrogenase (short-subunit alcohol dehydrogenase family)
MILILVSSVTSDESIATAAQQVTSKFGRLDVLINNAGIAPNEENLSSSALRTTYQYIFAVNTFGAALTTEAFIPLLSASTAPRIVFMSSDLASLANRWGNPVALPIYRSSKAALNMLMLHYALKYKDQGWKINANCPGYCATNLNAYAGYNTPESGALNAVRLATLGDDGETGTYSNKEGVIAW